MVVLAGVVLWEVFLKCLATGVALTGIVCYTINDYAQYKVSANHKAERYKQTAANKAARDRIAAENKRYDAGLYAYKNTPFYHKNVPPKLPSF